MSEATTISAQMIPQRFELFGVAALLRAITALAETDDKSDNSFDIQHVASLALASVERINSQLGTVLKRVQASEGLQHG